jgi:NADH-quinone oxidoreductase subunit C
MDDAPASRVLARLQESLPDAVQEVSVSCGVPIVRIDPARVVEVARFLKLDPDCRMTHLADLCGVDLSRLGRSDPRFDVVYHLFSLALGERSPSRPRWRRAARSRPSAASGAPRTGTSGRP